MENLLASISAKKAELDRLRFRTPGGTSNFDHTQDLELTYTSNAIEGNTLTAVETTMVIERGITVAGNPLEDHLEAIDHFDAIHYVRDRARRQTPISEMMSATCTGWPCGARNPTLPAATPIRAVMS